MKCIRTSTPDRGHQRGHRRAGHRADAPEAVEARHDRAAVEPLDGNPMCVHRDVEQTAEHAEHRQADGQRDQVVRDAGSDHREAEQRCDHADRHPSASGTLHATSEPGADEHADSEPAKCDAEVGVVEPQIVADCGDPGCPGRERGGMHEKRHPDGDSRCAERSLSRPLADHRTTLVPDARRVAWASGSIGAWTWPSTTDSAMPRQDGC